MANDNTLRVRYTTGKTLYVQIEAPDGTVWNTTSSAYAALTTASWTQFALAMTESPSGSGRYTATMPASSAAGNYTWTIYLQAGGSPATGDTPIAGSASGGAYWDGTTFGLASLTAKGLDNVTVEPAVGGGTAVNARQALAVHGAFAAGVLSGANANQTTQNISLQALGNPTVNRVVATTDANGNRSIVSLTLPT